MQRSVIVVILKQCRRRIRNICLHCNVNIFCWKVLHCCYNYVNDNVCLILYATLFVVVRYIVLLVLCKFTKNKNIYCNAYSIRSCTTVQFLLLKLSFNIVYTSSLVYQHLYVWVHEHKTKFSYYCVCIYMCSCAFVVYLNDVD